MADRALSGLLLVIAAVFGAFLFYRRLRSEGGKTASAALPTGAPADTGAAQQGGTPLDRLLEFARRLGLTVTSTTGGKHNVGSLHGQGRAIDVRSRGLTEDAVERIKAAAAQFGFRVRDERQRPAGQGVWGGPHLHIEEPLQRLGRAAP